MDRLSPQGYVIVQHDLSALQNTAVHQQLVLLPIKYMNCTIKDMQINQVYLRKPEFTCLIGLFLNSISSSGCRLFNPGSHSRSLPESCAVSNRQSCTSTSFDPNRPVYHGIDENPEHGPVPKHRHLTPAAWDRLLAFQKQPVLKTGSSHGVLD